MLGGDEDGVAFKDWAFQTWRDKYNVKPPWLNIDFMSLARALKVSESEQIARAAWRAYLASTDPFYVGHSPRKFLQSIDRWTVVVIPPPKAPKSAISDEYAAELRERHRQAVAKAMERGMKQ